ncbi:MAG: amidohydrolase family protein [Bernardetiaceae bacterium]|jgi:hypothetical protein|nr:amidohydrolase family protein [Bernardetiaceae bacterium]
MLIIDCHCHAGKGDGLTGPFDTDAPLKMYLGWAKAARIARTVLFAAFHSDYAVANLQVARIVASRPQQFYGFVFLHAERDRARAKSMVGHLVEKYGFCGIKVHRKDARLSRPVCEAARQFGIPILYDPMGEMAPVELAARQYPEVNFIIPHLGSFADDWGAQVNTISLLERFPNVYADTSGIRRFDVLLEAYRRAGAGKLLFGSDGPWLHPAVELEKVYQLPLTPPEQQQVLAGNLLRLIDQSGLMGRPPQLQRSVGNG